MKSEKWRKKMVLEITKQIIQEGATQNGGLLVALDLVRQISRVAMAPQSYEMFNDGLMDLLNRVAELENQSEDLDSYIDPTSPEFDADFAKEIIATRPDWFSQQVIDAVNDASRDA